MFSYVRDFIRDKFLICAIVSLPGDTFRRSGSRVKTSVLLLEKKRMQTDKQPGCFAFFSEYLGIDDLTPRASDADISAARAKAERKRMKLPQDTRRILSGKRGQLF